jgi:hypothetical protein
LLSKLSGTASQFFDGTGTFDSIAVGDLPSMTSADLAGKLTDETGTGSAVFASSPTITTPTFGNGTDNTHVEADGTLVFAGAATVWDDVNTGVAAAKTSSANVPDWTPFTANTNAYVFKVDDYADLSTIEIPHGYKEGTDIEVHLHIATNGTNNATERKVKYTAYYTYGIPDNGANQFSAEGSLTAELTIPANQLDKSVYYLSLGTISGTNLKVGTQLKLRFKRVTGTGTEPINGPFLGQVGVHFQKDTVGSRTISAK